MFGWFTNRGGQYFLSLAGECLSFRLWRTNWSGSTCETSFIRVMKDKMPWIRMWNVLHRVHERQIDLKLGAKCPSSVIWRTKCFGSRCEMSFIGFMKDKLTWKLAWNVFHPCYEGQNALKLDAKCPSSGSWKTNCSETWSEMSFIRVMKDKMLWIHV